MIDALIPAAGLSLRMGRAKLLIPFDGEPLIQRIVRAFVAGGARTVYVVTPPRSRPESLEISTLVEAAGGLAIVPLDQPADMRGSVEVALAQARPGAVLLAPADSPAISAEVVRTLINLHEQTPNAILIPTIQGKRGHPIVIPAELIARIPTLPRSLGINSLIAQEASRVSEICFDDPRLIEDLDSPEDYKRWTGQSLG